MRHLFDTVSGLRPTGRAALAVHPGVGSRLPLLLPASASGMREARGGRRTHSLEPRQESGEHADDGISGSLGAPALLARNSSGLRNQLGSRLPFGGMVREL